MYIDLIENADGLPFPDKRDDFWFPLIKMESEINGVHNSATIKRLIVEQGVIDYTKYRRKLFVKSEDIPAFKKYLYNKNNENI